MTEPPFPPPADSTAPYAPPQYGAPQYPGPAAPPYGQPYGSPYPPTSGRKNGLGVAALVLGIIAILFGWLVVGAVPGILAIAFGVIGRKRASRGEASNGGLATAGLVCGIIGTLIAAAVLSYVLKHRQEIGDYSDCVIDANGDQAAVRVCEDRFRDDLLNR